MRALPGLRTALSTDEITGIVLEKLAKKRESRVTGKVKSDKQNPKYHETREALWGNSGDHPQG